MPDNQSFLRLIKNEEHYNEVISRVTQVRGTLWIGTADIKDLHNKVGSSAVPFLVVLDTLLRRDVEVRLIHTNVPTLVDEAAMLFDHVWMGAGCAKCGRKQYCGYKIK